MHYASKIGKQESRMKQELEKLFTHIDDIEVAMMTTRRADGHLHSTRHGHPEARRWRRCVVRLARGFTVRRRISARCTA